KVRLERDRALRRGRRDLAPPGARLALRQGAGHRRTPEGRRMIALVVSKDRAFTPPAAAKTGKVVMLIQSGIHAGEIEGKDPSLMLVRDMVVGRKYAAWLDRMIFV